MGEWCPMKTILIIEDDRDIRESLQSFLETEGYNVSSAENGKKGLEKLKVEKRPSLIFLDLFMPQMSGLEFLKNYKQTQNQSPVVLVTACPQDNEEFLEAKSYSDYALKKPIDIERVLDLAKQYCQ